MSADAALMRASQEYNRTRNELATSLADAFARYQSQRVLLDYYRTQILQDQVQSYRAIYQRYQQDADSIDFNDVVTSQQTLASAISTYIQALGDQWQSMVEMAGLLQLDDLSQLDQFAAIKMPLCRCRRHICCWMANLEAPAHCCLVIKVPRALENETRRRRPDPTSRRATRVRCTNEPMRALVPTHGRAMGTAL